MAFGSVVGRGDVAAEADVVLRALTGEFKSDIREAEEVYERSLKQMSTESIKLALAQDKLDRALAKSPPTSRQVARAELERRRVIEQIDSSTRKLERDTNAADRAVGRFGRGALAGSGIMGGLGRSVAFASTTFLGGAGLLYAIRSTMDAAKEAEVVQGRLSTAVRNSGLSWDANRKQIEDTLQAQSRLSAFDDEDLASSLATLVVRTKDVNQALRLNGIAADVARGRNISLESASMLVLKAANGQAGALRRLGIDAKKGADATELLALIQQKYAGQAGEYAQTAAGKQELFNKTLQDSEEIIGGALTPAVSDLAGNLADYLGKLNESGELQRKVNTAVDDGTKIVHGLADGIDDVREVLGPVVEGLGGLERTAELALVVGLALKARKAAISFGLISTASTRTTAVVVADAARMEAALDAATRPRNVVITTTGVPGIPGSPGGGGRTVPVPGSPKGLRLPGTSGTRLSGATLGIAGYVAVTVIGSEALKAPPLRQQQLRVAETTAVDRDAGMRLARQFHSDYGTSLDDLTTARNPYFKTRGVAPLVDPKRRPDAAYLPGQSPLPKSGVFGGLNLAPKPPTPKKISGAGRVAEKFDANLAKTAAGRRLQLRLLTAESNDTSSTASLRDNVSANRAIADYYLAGLKTVKKGTAAYNDIYAEYVRYHQAELSAIDQINAEKERQRQARLDKQRKDQQREANARKKAQQEAEASARDAANQLYSSPHALHNARQHVIDPGKEKKAKETTEATTMQTLRRLEAEFLTSLHGLTNQFGSNFTAGQDVNGRVLVHLTREQNEHLSKITAGQRNPEARYGRRDAEYAMQGDF